MLSKLAAFFRGIFIRKSRKGPAALLGVVLPPKEGEK